MWMRRLTLALCLVLLTTFTVSSTDSTVIRLFVTTVNQDSPVQIRGSPRSGLLERAFSRT
jgi:hypothetical protein